MYSFVVESLIKLREVTIEFVCFLGNLFSPEQRGTTSSVLKKKNFFHFVLNGNRKLSTGVLNTACPVLDL